MEEQQKSIVTKVFIGDYEVIATGILNLFSGDFKVIIDDNVTFNFSIDKLANQEKAGFSMEVSNNQCLNINIKTANNPFSQGVYQPQEIGILRGRKLYIDFTFSNITQKNNFCLAVYNILLGEKVIG